MMTTFFIKISAKTCTNFEVSVSNFNSQSRDFGWSHSLEVLTRSQVLKVMVSTIYINGNYQYFLSV